MDYDITIEPIIFPTEEPTSEPTFKLTDVPTSEPTFKLTDVPTSNDLTTTTTKPHFEYMTLLIIPVILICVTKPFIIKKWCNILTCNKKCKDKEEESY